ncbi:hypothetical protein BDV25DRAFT_110523 [Aspergillus avenaceus]|uniref:Uncharacterized protein n=1 Tax=Aspergillus avenaceus TaxID=36643 RepID=A0A5N6TVY7_ASPAV|nr:hypothetical protein BDV25DRAFT_110523 [Aspergillus avenaceus]
MHLSHGFIAKVARDIGLSPPDGYDTQSSFVANNKCILISPLSDPAGVYFSIFNAIFNNTSTVLPNPEDPPTGKTLVQMLHHTRADWAALPSNTLSGVAKDSAVLDEIASHLELLVITGEPLAKKYGDVIASEVRLIHMPHSSETGLLPTIYRHGYNFKADWNYFQFHPAIGACLVPMSGDVYELIFDRTPETELYLTDFTNSYAFRAKDLYNRHPTMPDIWAPVSGSNVIFSMTGKAKPIEFNKHAILFTTS